MLGLKSILTLLLIGVVSTSPTDYGLDKRAMGMENLGIIQAWQRAFN